MCFNSIKQENVMLYSLIEIYNEIKGFDGYYINHNHNYKTLYRRIILTEMITRNKI